MLWYCGTFIDKKSLKVTSTEVPQFKCENLEEHEKYTNESIINKIDRENFKNFEVIKYQNLFHFKGKFIIFSI